MTLTATLCFMAKGVHAALGAQMCVGAGLEVVVVTAWRTGCVKVTRRTWRIVARPTVVKLTGWTLTLWAIVGTGRAVTELFGAFAFAWRTVTHTVTAHMAVGTGRAATMATAIAATFTACTFGFANALHHF